MLTKKFWLTVLIVFISLKITDIIISQFTSSIFIELQNQKILRSAEELSSKMWIVYLMDLIWSFFFVFIFSKGFENKGIMEGVRFGLYIGLFYSMITSYSVYTFFPLPYTFALTEFLTGLVQSVILGIIAALIYKPNPKENT